jgi:cytochrome c5
MKPVLVAVVAIAIVAAVAYAAISLMENLIPEGKPVVVQVKLLNDPADLSPREPNLPKGPHKEDFVSNCTTCHSTRLTMTQPNFPAAKWTEVVKKMVTVYGAKIDAPVEKQIVEYLAAIKGVK